MLLLNVFPFFLSENKKQRELKACVRTQTKMVALLVVSLSPLALSVMPLPLTVLPFGIT